MLFDEILQIVWESAVMERLVNSDQDFEEDALVDWQPVKPFEDWRDVLGLLCACQHACHGVLGDLQTMNVRLGCSCKEAIVDVQP